MSNCRLQRFEPFRDRRSRYIVFFGGSSAITREPLKVRWQVKHWQKGFREKYVCIWHFWQNRLFLVRFVKVFGHCQEKVTTPTFQLFEAFFRLRLLARIITNHQYQKSHFPLFSGENWGRKNAFPEYLKKSDFLWFYAKTAANTGFWSAPLERTRKIQQKQLKLFENLLSTLC